ncbi:ABC transporter transmembrane domain-containing protein [Brucella cytisi]|uniref:ABC transporter transmembrane domain-containing protein n=1 Tax=Brucella cytisi TaxID=407152 RepID=UPI0035D9F09F
MLKRFAAHFCPHRGLFVLDFSSAVAAGLLELAFPVAVTLFIDQLLPTGQLGLIELATVGLLLIYLVNAGLQIIVTYWGHMLGLKIETEMRRKAFDHPQKLSFGFFDNQKTGHLVARLTKDLEEIGEVAHHGPEDLFIAVMTLVGTFVLMTWVHVPLALITASIVPVAAIVTTLYGKRMMANSHSLFGRVGEFNARIEDHEQARLSAEPEPARRVMFYRFWSAKEALAKGLGLGLDLDFRRIAVGDPSRTGPVEVPFEASGGRDWFLHPLPSLSGFSAALASPLPKVRFALYPLASTSRLTVVQDSDTTPRWMRASSGW